MVVLLCSENTDILSLKIYNYLKIVYYYQDNLKGTK